MFDDEFIENLPENNWEALELIRDRFCMNYRFVQRLPLLATGLLIN